MNGMTKDSLRVLLVDDDPHDLFFAKIALKKGGFPPPIRELADGAAALEYFQAIENKPEEWPHVVIMDLKMPRMNGDEVLQWLREHPLYHGMPVIIFSSSDEIGDIKKSTRLGILRYIVKEVHSDLLISTLERFLALRMV
jgi:CheY-like chemotaxis protein